MINIGILGGADIAFRMFLPALQQLEDVSCILVASHQPERRQKFEDAFGVATTKDYQAVIDHPEIDAIYLPLPPSLHAEWGEKVLQAGKHLLLEKPSTICAEDTARLVALAKQKDLAIQENYMFQYHAQLAAIKTLLAEGTVGDVRLLRASFGFPLRSANDFRYSKDLGGGALLDAGGYVTKLASLLLGDTAKVKAATLTSMDGYDVDMMGTVTFTNQDGLTLQGGFGMDCHYQCALEVWGNRGKLFTNRIFTAPTGFVPTVTLETAEGTSTIPLPEDSHFKNSIAAFLSAMRTPTLRAQMAEGLLTQANLIASIKECANQ